MIGRCMKWRKHWGAAVLMAVVCAVALAASPAQAHKRGFVWSYEWYTPYLGEKEVEIWTTSHDEGSHWDLQLEYEFAVTPRYGVGIYTVFEERLYDELDYKGWKWENRYRLGEYENNRWLHAAYLEAKKSESEPYELEAKWLLTKYTKSGETAVFNLIAEKALTAGADVEWGYSAGWNRRAGENLYAGVESFGEFEDNEYHLGPNVAYDFDYRTRLVVGAAAGLNSRSDDWVLRAILELE